MNCSFCNKSAFKQYYLCDCCSWSLERCNTVTNNLSRTEQKSVPDIPPNEDARVQTIDADSRFVQTHSNELLRPQETIVVFRCAVCLQGYMTKEGLLNHLNLHGVADENKPLNCRETRVTHTLLKCAICNDQRGYPERQYWQHVHEDHDGFFLLCSGCGESFRSQKLLTDHVLNHCTARIQPPISNETTVQEQMTNVKTDYNLSTVIHCPICSERFGSSKKDHLAEHVKVIHQLFICTICETILPSVDQLEDHKVQQHSTPFEHQDSDRQPVSNTDRYATSFHDFPAATDHEFDPYFVDADSFGDGWEHYSTGPVQDIEAHVLTIEFGFRFKSQNVSSRGKMRYYRCRRMKYRAVPQCDRKLLVFIPNTKVNATVCLKGEHTCTNAPPANLARAKFYRMDYELTPSVEESGVPCRDQVDSLKRDANCEPIEMIQPTSSHSAPAPVHDINPAHLAEPMHICECKSIDDWEIHSTVPIQDVESHVLSIEFGFRYKSQNETHKGRMRYYNCRRMKFRAVPQCKRKLQVCITNTNTDATISLKGSHTCANAPPENLARPNLNEMDYTLITNLVNSGMASRYVIRRLRKVNSTVSVHQLQYAVKLALKNRGKSLSQPIHDESDNSIS